MVGRTSTVILTVILESLYSSTPLYWTSLKVSFKLPIGIYTLTQISSKTGYNLIRNEEIEIIDSNPILLSYINNPIPTNPHQIETVIEEPTIEPEPVKEEEEDILKLETIIEVTEEKEKLQDTQIVLDEESDDLGKIPDIPQTGDNIKSSLLISLSGIIIIIANFLKNLTKKKEIKEK